MHVPYHESGHVLNIAYNILAGGMRLEDIELRRQDEAIDIPKEAAHRVSNPGQSPLVFIEIQRGGYLGEDDIIRLEDDYGRS